MYRRIRLLMTLTLGALAAMLLFAPLDVAAQGGSITGRVTDSQTGQLRQLKCSLPNWTWAG